MNKEEKDCFYAFKVIPLQDLKRSKFVIESSCETCGHPFLQAGHMCPKCIMTLDESIPGTTEIQQPYSHPHHIDSPY